jgi:hypothetical protein
MMIEAIPSSETSVLTRVTLRHNPEDGILQLYDTINGSRIRGFGKAGCITIQNDRGKPQY